MYANNASIPRVQFVVAVRRGRKTRYFWGNRLKDCLPFVREREEFVYAKFTRGKLFNAAKFGRVIVTKWSGK